jgi:CubicO group peptidase (beta-lactamase class C family)
VDRVPGKEFRYSGGGYVAVQLLLMDVTHKSFPELMYDLVFEPLEMKHSTFEVPLRKSLWPEAAKPYASNGTLAEGGWPLGYPAMAPAGLWKTQSAQQPPDEARHIPSFFRQSIRRPNGIVRVRQVNEWHRWGYEMANFLKDLAT